jgi:diguanylate cyclase (GGDEF)-like protein
MPSDPICYTVAYEYLNGNRPTLKQEFDKLDPDDNDYLQQIQQVYQQCIICQDFKNLAMSEATKPQYVNDILLLLLKSNKTSTDSPKIEPNNNSEQVNKDDYLSVVKEGAKDKLTGAVALETFKQAIEMACQSEENVPTSVLLINVDRFKNFNDCNGEMMGNAVLKNLVKTLLNNTTKRDFVGRVESDEFLVMLCKTDASAAVILADKIRQVVSTISLKKKHSNVALKFTVSIGVSEMTGAGQYDNAFQKAKNALKRSKELGKNCVNKEV